MQYKFEQLFEWSSGKPIVPSSGPIPIYGSNGIIGFETALSAEIMNLIDTGDLTYLDLVRVTSYNPAKLLKIDRGTIEEGKIADITIFDPNEKYVYTKEMIVSKSKNSPFIGKELKGKVKYTIVGGRIVYGEGI